MIAVIKAFSAQELVDKINSDHGVKSVVAIVKDGSEFCAFTEYENVKNEKVKNNVRNSRS